MFSYALFLLSLISVAAAAGVGETAAYQATDLYLLNCGATSETQGPTGRTWSAEDMKLLTSNSANASFSSTASVQDPSVPRVPYMTARIFRSEFTYGFSVSRGWKFVRLYFYPTRYGSDFDAVSSFFSVAVNGYSLVRNFSAHLTVTASIPESKSIIKEFILPVVNGHRRLNLTFTPSLNSSAFVNGIEIVSMPDGLYSNGLFDDRIVGSSISFDLDNTTAFEMVYRLNVGGAAVADVDDTGMFRQWVPDFFYIPEAATGVTPYVPGVRIKYTQDTPAYIAPEAVYTSYRTMGNAENSLLNLNFNLTWILPVDAGFNYLVRLHFCETMKEVTKVNQRAFSIFIRNWSVVLDADVIGWSGGSGVPVFRDFIANVPNRGEERGIIRLDLLPYMHTKAQYADAILNGVEILKLNNTEGSLTRPVLSDSVSDDNLAGPLPPSSVSHSRRRSQMVLRIVIGTTGSVIAVVIILTLIWLKFGGTRFFSSNRKTRNDLSNRKLKAFIPLKCYSYSEVKRITKSFANIVGRGGFGTVYRGKLADGSDVAVKVLKESKGNGEDFINEVASMSKTSHVNIVSLLGFCHEGSKRVIIYEFVENGSLDQFILSKSPLSADWRTLYEIALGVARGLEYLHYGCKTRIVHFDIKPQNILLDGNLRPKVSDFGLAKLCEKKESIMSLLEARGTFGYMAPEVFSRNYGRVSHKSDVYSYGMLVLEMIGARNNNRAQNPASSSSSVYFPDWIYKDLEQGEDTRLLGDEISEEEGKMAKKMILVGLWCIQSCPSDRPPMNKVVEMMEGSLDSLEVPPKPVLHHSAASLRESPWPSEDSSISSHA